MRVMRDTQRLVLVILVPHLGYRSLYVASGFQNKGKLISFVFGGIRNIDVVGFAYNKSQLAFSKKAICARKYREHDSFH